MEARKLHIQPENTFFPPRLPFCFRMRTHRAAEQALCYHTPCACSVPSGNISQQRLRGYLRLHVRSNHGCGLNGSKTTPFRLSSHHFFLTEHHHTLIKKNLVRYIEDSLTTARKVFFFWGGELFFCFLFFLFGLFAFSK